MGYKLAGYEVLGGVEIDPQMMRLYKKNHNPKHSYLMGVQDFKNIPNKELPDELFNLDILDGSPPCSSFSMAGAREKKWGSASKFREGQAVQNLDDLFFDFIDVAENVKGLIQGNAKGYVKQIFQQFKEIGYDCQLFLLNAARMGVPQLRERTFFIANKLNKKIKLDFQEEPIPFESATKECKTNGKELSPMMKGWFEKTPPGWAFSDVHPNKSYFNSKKTHPQQVALTQTASTRLIHFKEPRYLSDSEVIKIQTFPFDYDFLGQDVQYICGMSVPPFMMQRVSLEIYKQWF